MDKLATTCFRVMVPGLCVLLAGGAGACAANESDLATRIRQIGMSVYRSDEMPQELLGRDIRDRLVASGRQSSDEWKTAAQSVGAWEAFRQQKLDRLRAVIGDWPVNRAAVTVHLVREIRDEGYSIRCITYDGHAGHSVAAHLYVPERPRAMVPGILISHSHHAPKAQRELQEMGALWSRAGCYVLVPDHIGHGDRRDHPFSPPQNHVGPYQIGRQDYYFRFHLATQFYVAGETLVGQMAGDLSRGVDVLLSQPGIDSGRIALFGSVAGGGDPAAVAGALDSRIQLVVPFNFGGPQPESPYPLPEDAERSFLYAGSGSWESTRNLYRSAIDGFLPWVIVASIAPRGLIHAHEFSWDQPRDPVYRRYQAVFRGYQAEDRLDYAHGYGLLHESSAEASHCTNIGKVHRERIHGYLAKHWQVSVDESRPVQLRDVSELTCRDSDSEVPVQRSVRRVLTDTTRDRREQWFAEIRGKSGAEVADSARRAWQERLGKIDPPDEIRAESRGSEHQDGLRVERWLLRGERELSLPLVLFVPTHQKPIPVVLVLNQGGKKAWRDAHVPLFAKLLEHAAVCLVDLRGIGELAAGSDRGRRSSATALAASELMFGETLVGARLRDARYVLDYLRTRQEFGSLVVLGDSLAQPNGPDVSLDRPLDADQPPPAEPLGATLTLFLGLFERSPLILACRGGLVSYSAVLDRPFMHVPFDAIVPGAATLGDLPQVAELARRQNPLWIGGLVDSQNRPVPAEHIPMGYGSVVDDASDAALAAWLIQSLGDR